MHFITRYNNKRHRLAAVCHCHLSVRLANVTIRKHIPRLNNKLAVLMAKKNKTKLLYPPLQFARHPNTAISDGILFYSEATDAVGHNQDNFPNVAIFRFKFGHQLLQPTGNRDGEIHVGIGRFRSIGFRQKMK